MSLKIRCLADALGGSQSRLSRVYVEKILTPPPAPLPPKAVPPSTALSQEEKQTTDARGTKSAKEDLLSAKGLDRAAGSDAFQTGRRVRRRATRVVTEAAQAPVENAEFVVQTPARRAHLEEEAADTRAENAKNASGRSHGPPTPHAHPDAPREELAHGPPDPGAGFHGYHSRLGLRESRFRRRRIVPSDGTDAGRGRTCRGRATAAAASCSNGHSSPAATNDQGRGGAAAAKKTTSPRNGLGLALVRETLPPRSQAPADSSARSHFKLSPGQKPPKPTTFKTHHPQRTHGRRSQPPPQKGQKTGNVPGRGTRVPSRCNASSGRVPERSGPDRPSGRGGAAAAARIVRGRVGPAQATTGGTGTRSPTRPRNLEDCGPRRSPSRNDRCSPAASLRGTSSRWTTGSPSPKRSARAARGPRSPRPRRRRRSPRRPRARTPRSSRARTPRSSRAATRTTAH